MTAIAANDCSNGVILSGDAMTSVSVGDVPLMSRPTTKITQHDDGSGNPTILGLAGDQGLNLRFKSIVDEYPNLPAFVRKHGDFNQAVQKHLHYPTALSWLMINHLGSTGINPTQNPVGFAALLGYTYNGKTYCCKFLGDLQPIPLDKNNYYDSVGSGSVQALPTLRELDDARYDIVGAAVHSKRALTPPDYVDGCLMAYWAIHRTLRTSPAWVGHGIDMLGLVERTDEDGNVTAIEVNEIDEARMDIYNMRVEEKEQLLMD